jgi:hypothetical protein
MRVASSPDAIFWGKKGFRDAVAKAAAVLADQIWWHRVLPATDAFGRLFTEVSFVVQTRDPQGTIDKLVERLPEDNLKNKVGAWFSIEVLL